MTSGYTVPKKIRDEIFALNGQLCPGSKRRSAGHYVAFTLGHAMGLLRAECPQAAIEVLRILLLTDHEDGAFARDAGVTRKITALIQLIEEETA